MIEFDPDKDFEKVREFGKGVRLVQNGYVFTSGYKLLGKSDTQVKIEAAQSKAEAKAGIESRAQDSIDTLDGFKTPEAPGSVQSALDENRQAKAAEEADALA